MKKIIILLIVNLLLLHWVHGQKKSEKNIPWQPGKIIYLDLKYAHEISLKTWDKNEIGVAAIVNINNNANNDNFEITEENREKEIIIASKIRDIRNLSSSVVIQQNGSNYYTSGYQNGFWDRDENVYINIGKTVSADINLEIFIPKGAEINLKTIGGNVDYDCQQAKARIETINGEVNIKAGGDDKLLFSVSTIEGDVYTNLELKALQNRADGMREVGGKFEKELSLNGGGQKITIKTLNGNIYLVKKEL